MASAAEQLAANMNFGAFQKATDLHKRLWFTLGRADRLSAGHLHPDPRHRHAAPSPRPSTNQSKGILGMFNMFSGGAVQRMAIFTLNVMPYISASIIVQLMTTMYPPWEKLKKESQAGQKQLNQYTRYLTVILALVQSFGIAQGLSHARGVVDQPGPLLHRLDHGDADRRHAVLDVARRADDHPRRRQRHQH